jgi:dimethylargininase
MADVLSRYRPVERLVAPATLDGGDVLCIGRSLYVGQTPRTNAAAATQLSRLLSVYGYLVVSVAITRCLHLKSGCSRLDDRTVLLNPHWIDPITFAGLTTVPVDDSETWGANAVRVGETVVFPASEPKTRAAVERCGYRTAAVDVSELQKAEAGVTCLSLIFETA